MNPTNNRIIVRVNISQKSEMLVGGVLLKTATSFDTNYREKSPVIAEVVDGNAILKKGDIIVIRLKNNGELGLKFDIISSYGTMNNYHPLWLSENDTPMDNIKTRSLKED